MVDAHSGNSHKLLKLEAKQRAIILKLGTLANRLTEVGKCETRSHLTSKGNVSISTPLNAKRELCEEKAGRKQGETRTLENVNNLLIKYFINLTDGIEVLHELPNLGIPRNEINFVRIMSSHCEANDFEGVLLSLDHNLMTHLALGHVCLVYDLGSRDLDWPNGIKGVSRAIWWGIEWIRYALSRCWRLQVCQPVLRGEKVSELFGSRYLRLSKKVKKKMRYYRLILRCERVLLFGVFRRTVHDGEREFYRDLLWKFYPKSNIKLPMKANVEDAEEKQFDSERFIKDLDIVIPEGMNVYFQEHYPKSRLDIMCDV
mmetsp:Transcript_37715/g.60545  ORF Transcript_37715/g.60545 Transcript_37715/m.60545 type:complete len:315 (-) Transcript_37715:38-982(-)